MLERRRDLAAVVSYAAAASAAVWVRKPAGVGGLFLAPLLLVCPGYALVRAIESRRDVETLELATTTLALSFASAALGGLLLNTLNVPLTARAWSTLMLVVTAAAAAIAAWRAAGADQPARRRLPMVRPLPLVAAVATCVLLVAAAAVAYRSQKALDRRTSVATLAVRSLHRRSALRISVVNSDAAPNRYRIGIEAGGRTSRFSLALGRGERWSGTRLVSRAARGPVTVRLFRAAKPGRPLRSVTLR